MKKNLWIVLGVLSVASLFFVYQYFDKVVPFVHVKITMDSAQARTVSQELARKYQWDVEGYDLAVQFKSDGELQAFVELEGGGKPSFIEMIEKDYHQPYEWIVRFYKPSEIREILIGYTPDGKPYEFLLKIPEAQQGAVLSRAHADEIAQAGAKDWGVDLSVYDFVEHHSIMQPGGRMDHTFVYERHDVTLQKGLYRLTLKVCGDVFATLDRSVKIPDEFKRRYAQMFADNKLLANMTSNIAIFLYLFVIAFLCGIFFYRDRRYLLVRSHVYVMMFFAAIYFASSLNSWPLLWNHYPTHMPVLLFMFNALVGIVIGSVLFSLFVGIICVITDAADRYVFGRHIQFLKSWSPGVGGSYQILQMTMLGYVGAILMLGYETLYTLWTQYMGWWSPLSTLIDPNVLSSYLPFLSPVAMSFQAGFWEEFALRGLPLAGIMFLTRNSRYKAWWFGGMMIVQALIFGALHANYPQMPAYYRVIELIIPSLTWGMFFYWFGLLPGIIAHFVYDALLFCIPIWISCLIVQKIICVVCILIPFWVVVIHWLLQKRKFVKASASAYNHTVRYQEPLEDKAPFHRAVGKPFSLVAQLVLIVFGLVGFGFLYISNEWNFATPAVKITRSQAEAIATPVAQEMNDQLDESWTISSEVVSPVELDGNKFIWQEYGQLQYQALQSSYVVPTYFLVSWKKFTGSVEDRAEELKVLVGTDGAVLGKRHVFPEGRPGADLSECDAQQVALSEIQKMYGIAEAHLELVSCETKKHPERRDYKIVYKDIVSYTLDRGQGRITISLAGNQLSEIQRNVYAPEVWQRDENSRQTKSAVFKMILFVFVILWCLIATTLGIRKYGFSVKLLVPVGFLTIAFVAFRVINFVNAWTHIVNNFSTSEPWMHQVVSTISSYLIGYLALGFALSILTVLMVLQGARLPNKKSSLGVIALIFAGVGLAGFEMFTNGFKVLFAAHDYQYDFINYSYPAFNILIAYYLNNVIVGSAIMMALCVVARFVELRCHGAWVVLLFMLAGVAMSDAASLTNICLWLGSGLCLGMMWYFLYRCIILYNLEAILLIMFGVMSCKLIPSIWYGAYPGIFMHSMISFVLFLGLLVALYRKI